MKKELNALVPRLVHGVLHWRPRLPPVELPVHPARKVYLDHMEEDQWHVCVPYFHVTLSHSTRQSSCSSRAQGNHVTWQLQTMLVVVHNTCNMFHDKHMWFTCCWGLNYHFGTLLPMLFGFLPVLGTDVFTGNMMGSDRITFHIIR